MKRVLLVNTNSEKVPYPVPPVGLCLVANSIKQAYDVQIYDCMFEERIRLVNIINDYRPDYIGLSIRNIDNLEIENPICYVDLIADRFIKKIKKNTSVPIILGGSGFSIFPEILMKTLDADYGVIGEGEEAFLKLLDSLDKGKDVSMITGIIVKGNKNYMKSTYSYDLSNLSFSEIDLKLNFSSYKEESAYSIQTKRGCYHKCIYCTYPYIEGRSFRTRSPKDIADEIEQVYNRLGYTLFEFVDSTFNDPPGHAEDICREISKRKMKIRLRAMGINPAHATKELFELMLSAGFAQIDCTPDTASLRMISNLKKNFTFSQLKNTAKIIKEYDMPTIWFFIFGGPGENEDTIKESFDFIDKCINNYDVVHMTLGLRIYPNTDLYNIAVKEGKIKRDENIISPKYYISKELDKQKIKKIISEKAKTRPNCITATESTAPLQMIEAAKKIRKKFNLTEPMFRTLLRLRYQMFEKMKFS